jgi:hypothetical protein
MGCGIWLLEELRLITYRRRTLDPLPGSLGLKYVASPQDVPIGPHSHPSVRRGSNRRFHDGAPPSPIATD